MRFRLPLLCSCLSRYAVASFAVCRFFLAHFHFLFVACFSFYFCTVHMRFYALALSNDICLNLPLTLSTAGCGVLTYLVCRDELCFPPIPGHHPWPLLCCLRFTILLNNTHFNAFFHLIALWDGSLICHPSWVFVCVVLYRFHTRPCTECQHGLLMFSVHHLMRSTLGSTFPSYRNYAGSIANLLIAYDPRLLYA